MNKTPYIYSRKKIKILNIGILLLTFFIFILCFFKINIYNSEIPISLYIVVLINVISIILFISTGIRAKFKNIELIASIFQLISSIIFFIFSLNIEGSLLEKIIYFMIFTSFIIMALGEGKEEIDKSKPIENSEIKDDVEKWIQDCYICEIVMYADKENYNKISGREKNYDSIEGFRKSLVNLWDIHSREEVLEYIKESCVNNFLQKYKNKLKEKGFNNRQELLNRIEYLKSKENLSEEEMEEKASLISLDGYFAFVMCDKLDLLGTAYIANYITRKEFREYGINICKIIQKEFFSWEDLMENFLTGDTEYFEKLGKYSNKTSSYKMLKDERLAYQLDWNLNLE